MIAYYHENSGILSKALRSMGYQVHGGIDAPYLWVYCNGKKSWDVFDEFLNEYQLVVTPVRALGLVERGLLGLQPLGAGKQFKLLCQGLIRLR